MDDRDLLREYYDDRIRRFGHRKFEELNEYQLKHIKGSFSYNIWRWSRKFDSNVKALRKRFGWE